MSKYRSALPQLSDELFLTDGGIETTLIFHDGLQLPDFASFYALKDVKGKEALRRYFRSYVEIAQREGTGLILESATWRASSDWGRKLGYSRASLADANRQAVSLLEEMRDEFEERRGYPLVISGCVGPRGDGYIPDNAMSAEEAEQYHSEQVTTFAATTADMICAITMNYAAEAIGVTHAARKAEMPAAIAFTVETDGNLPTGQPLADAIEEVDANTSSYPSYYMINCAHPNHFEHVLTGDRTFDRIYGLRANASTKSHAELNESTALDTGNPQELGLRYAQIKRRLKNLKIIGGCCGTDHRHLEEIAKACTSLFVKPSQQPGPTKFVI